MRVLSVTRQFKKDFRHLSTHLQTQTDAVAQQLREKPTDTALDIKRLHGFAQPSLWRVRIGDYRMVYTFDKGTITLHRVCHRKDVYRRL